MCDDRIELWMNPYSLWKSSDGHPRKKWEARGGNDGSSDWVPWLWIRVEMREKELEKAWKTRGCGQRIGIYLRGAKLLSLSLHL